MSIVWDDNLATGVKEIDQQHKEIFARFNKLFAACSEGKGKEEVATLILFLRDYIHSHFAAEEKLQIKSDYPLHAAHKSQHTSFMHDVERLERSVQEEGATLSLVIQTNKTLASWLVQHIGKTDMEFAKFLKGQ